MTCLYICVDESGNHSQDSCYVVAGCWFVSERTRVSDVLTPTKDKLLDGLKRLKSSSKPPNELKGAAMRPAELSHTVSELTNEVYNDKTIIGRTPWRQEYPVGFTGTTLNGELFRSAVEDYHGRLTGLELLQVAAISSVLNPVFHTSTDLSIVDSVRVVFDATTWKRVSDHTKQFVDDQKFTFETRDSRSVPGIQFADLAAYSWRRQETEVDCLGAIEALEGVRFAV